MRYLVPGLIKQIMSTHVSYNYLMRDKNNKAKGSGGFNLRVYFPFLIFLLSLYYIPRIESYIGTENIKSFLADAGLWAALGFIIIRVITIVISPLLLGPIAVLANRAFGFWPAVILNTIAELIGASINYWLGRIFGDKLLKFFFGKQIAGLVEQYSHKYLTKNTLATSLLMYGYNYELVSYACGIAQVPYKQFLISLVLSITLSVPLMVWQDISIGNNNVLAIGINIFGFITGAAALWYVSSEDIKGAFRKFKYELQETQNNQ